MNRLKEWITAMFGRMQTRADEDARVILDRAEGRIAGRLSKLTGKRRDEVLRESYRRADKILGQEVRRR
jgi:hypothetical protein